MKNADFWLWTQIALKKRVETRCYDEETKLSRITTLIFFRKTLKNRQNVLKMLPTRLESKVRAFRVPAIFYWKTTKGKIENNKIPL